MESSPILSAQDFWSAYAQHRLEHIQNVSSLCNPDAIAQARQTIDDELAAMHLAICALRTQRNALAPVSRLPPEVLARIFLFTATIFPPMTRHERLADRNLGWIQVTHVCKVWRETALHYPHLWTDIHVGLNTPWLEVVLARGKAAPISVIFDKFRTTVGRPYWCMEVSKHRPRIRDLRLDLFADSTRSSTAYQSMLTSPAINLQYLCLRHYNADLWLSEHILQDYAPMLCSVDLQNVYIPWSAPILRNLIHLKVELYFDKSSLSFIVDDIDPPVPTFSQLLDALRRMPALETLSLTRCLPPWPRQFTNDGVVDLPYLKSLFLSDEHKHSSYFIQSVRIPSSCALSLLCFEGEEPEITIDIFSFFHAHATREPAALHSLVLKIYDGHCLFTVSRMAVGDDAETETWHTIQLPSSHEPSKTMWDVIVSSCRSFPIANVRYLEFVPIMSTPIQQWADVLEKCKMVEEVRFEGGRHNTLNFCTALATHVDQEGGALFLENLHRLTLKWFVLASEGESEHSFYRALLDRLGTRQKARVIHTVCLESQMMQREEWFTRQLEEIIPQVIYKSR